MKKGIKELAAVLILSGLNPAGGVLAAAEFEVLDRFSVGGYSVLKGSADIPGGSFAVGGSTLVVKNGNVGIGTAAPGLQLDVYNSGAGGAALRTYNPTAGTGNFAQLRAQSDSISLFIDAFSSLYANNGAYLANGSFIGNGGSGGMSLAAYDTAGVLRFYTAGSAAGNERMRIDSAGNIGIGTTGYTHIESSQYKASVNYKGADTNTINNVLAVGHQTTGTPAAGIGAGIAFVTDNIYAATSELGSIAAVQSNKNR